MCDTVQTSGRYKWERSSAGGRDGGIAVLFIGLNHTKKEIDNQPIYRRLPTGSCKKSQTRVVMDQKRGAFGDEITPMNIGPMGGQVIRSWPALPGISELVEFSGAAS
jgi:hypothetical protein